MINFTAVRWNSWNSCDFSGLQVKKLDNSAKPHICLIIKTVSMKKIYAIVATVALASAGSVSAVADVVSTLPESAEVKTYARAANLFTTFWGATFPQEEDMLPGKLRLTAIPSICSIRWMDLTHISRGT